MAKNENNEKKENLSNNSAPEKGSDTNKKKNYRYKRRRPFHKNNNQSEQNINKNVQADTAPQSPKKQNEQEKAEQRPKQNNQNNRKTNPKPNNRNNRYNKNNRNKPQNTKPHPKKDPKAPMPLPEEEIRELEAVPEEPNVDMDFSFLEASREDIEDMIAEMDEEGNDVTEDNKTKDKYKKEKIIIGAETEAGSVLMPAFFKRVAIVKEQNKKNDEAKTSNHNKLANKPIESKNDVKTERAIDTDKKKTVEENKEKSKTEEKKLNEVKTKKLSGAILSRIFLEKYNLIKPLPNKEKVKEEERNEEKSKEQQRNEKKGKEEKRNEEKGKGVSKIDKHQNQPNKQKEKVIEKVEEEEPANDEDIYKFDRLSFDPKIQRYDKDISFEKVESVAYISQRTSLSVRQEKNNSVRKVLDLVDEFLTKELHIDHTFNILLAVSGGVDSVVLFDAVALLSEKYNYQIAMAHYNHNLRGAESDADEKFVKQFADKYNTKIFTANGKVRAYSEKNSLSIEHAARILRYKFFERTSRNIDADFVATAHTADDSAETLLLNLLRGSGLTGLAGIPKIRTFVKNVRLIRPLIELRKEDLIAYAKERRLVWKEDQSNQLLDYTRNKVRLSLLPMLEKTFNPNIIETLNRTAKLINGADEFISDMVTNSIEHVIDDVRQERFAVKTNLLETFPEFVQGEIIQQLVNKYFRISSLPMKKIADILELMKHQSGAIYQINKNYNVLMDRKRLIFTRVEDYAKVSESFLVEQGFENAEFSLNVTPVRKKDIKFNENPFEEYIDKSKITKALKIRHWEEGDTFIPLGMYGRMKVSDFLTNEKVALIDKSKIMVLVSGSEIVWIIGHRVSDKFKVDRETREAYKLDFQNKNGYKNEQKSDGLE